MKLETFNAENTVAHRRGLPLLSINLKTGLFSINCTAAELIDLKKDTMVQFHQDEEEEDNWFIEKVKQDGFVVRISDKASSPQYIFNSSALARTITNEGDLCGKFIIAGEPTTIEGKRKLFGLLRRPAT